MEYIVQVNMEIIDGRYYFKIMTTKGLCNNEIMSILAGGLNLSIRCEKTPEEQGEALRNIISFMEKEFVSTDMQVSAGKESLN